MKRISFFGTPFYMYLTEIPFVVILIFAIIYNPYAEGWAKFYPLICAMAAAIIFANIFLFRGVSLSRCKIRDIGRFSPRDSAELKLGSSIRLQPQKGGRVKIYVYGEAGLPELDWMREQTTNPDEICMYRGRAEGGIGVVSSALSYFGVPNGEIEKIITGESFDGDYSECKVSTQKLNDEAVEYRIELKQTVLELDVKQLELSSGVTVRSHRLSTDEWETVISRDGEDSSIHRSRKIKKQISRILMDYEASQSDIRELFGGDAEIDLDLIYASSNDGVYTVIIK